MLSPFGIWRRFLDRPNDDRVKIFGVAIMVALVCSIVVSSASIALRPIQEAQLERERAARMEAMLDALPGMRQMMEEAGVDSLETRIVNLETGLFSSEIDPASFDYEAARIDPEQNVIIPPGVDFAGLRQRAAHAAVHLLERDGNVELIVLPVSGTGYQSTIRAMLALEADLKTIAALTIISHGETAGLGSKIDEPAWQAKWTGKQTTDEAGNIVIYVTRGPASGPYEVDGISGATMTGNGISDMLYYWLGDHGFGPFLTRLNEEGL